ncbi:bifunctional hydroxymethylpyrimidine kinase/phosphomethylpyrimidine kinase [Nocardioides aequoreus]|uniref:bifunctional hydroxymethylpyrimidine kinase/phosphomethylpyrimidine kinase n=1 Tax=Nocardioides aequoreus TaxID=397278 RepID=UPI00056BBAD6|nr:bifunctional hydroxymethylpyrimidine kinase/phosphomethylpyrimidine kinase [Nocardioides aequoreus]
MIPRVLSVAGSDPSGGAGVQADLKSIAAQGGYGMAVLTALTAQNTRGVRSVHVPPVGFLREQLDAVSDDVRLDAVKVGMLGSAAVAAEVADWLEKQDTLAVVDPVMVSTSGDRLLDPDAEEALRELLPRADLLTPNLHELALLARAPLATTWETALAQAMALSEETRSVVLLKGGHLPGDSSPDALVDAARPPDAQVDTVWGERVDTPHTHGTGCSLSSAMATRLAAGDDWDAALHRVKAWLHESLLHAHELHVGGGHGPVHHFHALWRGEGLPPEDR